MERIGRYAIQRTLASGTYQATDPESGDEVAIELLERPDDPARFEREAQAWRRLQHRSVVRLRDVGEHEGRPFLVLDQHPDGSLAAALARRPLSPASAVRIGSELAAGLSAAHAAGLFHHDLRPENVLIRADGSVLLTRFGIGSASAQDPQADVRGLAALLFTALTGQPPSSAPLRERSPDAPPELERLLADCLLPAPGDRPSLAELRKRLGRLAREESTSNPLLVVGLLTVIGVLVVVLGVALAFSGGGLADEPAQPAASAQAQLLVDGQLATLLEQLRAPEGWKAPGLDQLSPADRARLAAWTSAEQPLAQALKAVEPAARQRALRWALRKHTGRTPEESALTRPAARGWEGIAQGEEALARGLSGVAALRFAAAAQGTRDAELQLSAHLGLARAQLALGDLDAADAALVAARDAELTTPGPTLARARWQLVARRVFTGADPARAAKLAGAAERGLKLPTPPTRVARLRESLRTTDSYEQSSAEELRACADGLDGAEGLLLAHACRLAWAAERGNHRPSARAAAALLEGTVLRLRPESPSAWIALARARLVTFQAPQAETASREALVRAPRDPQSLILAADVLAAKASDSDEPHRLLEVVDAYRRLYPKLPPARVRAVRLRAARWLLERARLRKRNRGAEAIEQRKRLREALEAELKPLLEPRSGPRIDANELSGVRRSASYLAARGDLRGKQRKLLDLARKSTEVTPAQLEALRLRIGAGDQSAPQHAEAYLALVGDVPADGAQRVRNLEAAPRDSDAQRALRHWVGTERTLMLPYVRLRAEELVGARGRTPASLERLARAVLDGPELTLHTLALLASGAAPTPPAPDSPLRRLARALASRAAPLGFVGGSVRAAAPADAATAQAALLDADAAVRGFPDRAGAYLVRAWVRLALGGGAPIRARVRQDAAIARAAAPWAWPALLLLHHATPSPGDALREDLLVWGLLSAADDPRVEQVRGLLARRNLEGVEAEIDALAGPRLRLVLRAHFALSQNHARREPTLETARGAPPGWLDATRTLYRTLHAGPILQRDPQRRGSVSARIVEVGLPALTHTAPQGQRRRLSFAGVRAPGLMPSDASERARTGAPSHPQLWSAAFWLHTDGGLLGALGTADELRQARRARLRVPDQLFDGISRNTALLYAAQASYTDWTWRWLVQPPSGGKPGQPPRVQRIEEAVLAAERYVAFLRGVDPVKVYANLLQAGLRVSAFQLKDRRRLEYALAYAQGFARGLTGDHPRLVGAHLDLVLDLYGWLKYLHQKGPERTDPLLRQIQTLLGKLPPVREHPQEPQRVQRWRRLRANVALGDLEEARRWLVEVNQPPLRDPLADFGPLHGRFLLSDPLRAGIVKAFPRLEPYLTRRKR